jgi:hypothetical protein
MSTERKCLAQTDWVRRFGWVYELEDRVALTGAGAYHAGEITGGMLGG